MGRCGIVTFFIFLYIVCVVGKTPFHDGIIQEVTIYMKNSSYVNIFEERNDDYERVDILWEEKVKKHIGFQLHSASPARYCEKPGCQYKFDFKIETDKFDDDKTLMGESTLYLQTNHNDPSNLRETIASLAFSDLANGRRTGLINLHIEVDNSTIHLGSYTVLQSVDQEYIADHFPDGMREAIYKLSSPDASLVYRGDSKDDYSSLKQYGDHHGDGSALISFIAAINNGSDISVLKNCTNISNILGYIAVSSFTGCSDSPVGSGRMLYSYGEYNHDISNNTHVSFISYITKDAFGADTYCSDPVSYEEHIEQDFLNPLCSDLDIQDFPLLSVFLRRDDIFPLYLDMYKTMLHYTFDEKYLSDFIDYTLYNIGDTMKEIEDYNLFSHQEFLCSIEREEPGSTCPSDIIPIQQYIRDRKASVLAQMEALGVLAETQNKATNIAHSLLTFLLPILLLLLCTQK